MQPIFVPAARALSPILQRLRSRPHLPPLFPTQPWDPALSKRISALTPAELTGNDRAEGPVGEALRSGLLLWNDDLEAGHAIAQGIENPTGSYWHGIMHRREGDLDNARYWFRRVGAHPAFARVRAAALAALTAAGAGTTELATATSSRPAWDPFALIDRCEAARSAAGAQSAGEAVRSLEIAQLAEIEALLGWEVE